jgi:hypothetical protein
VSSSSGTCANLCFCACAERRQSREVREGEKASKIDWEREGERRREREKEIERERKRERETE